MLECHKASAKLDTVCLAEAGLDDASEAQLVLRARHRPSNDQGSAEAVPPWHPADDGQRGTAELLDLDP